jgi:rabenosyn-5
MGRSIFSLTNRKHHCRLCGRIVCSLAPTPLNILALTKPLTNSDGMDRGLNPRTGLPIGTRREKCSLLLVADWKTGRGEEVEEGFVGWMRIGNDKKGEMTEVKDKEGRRADEVQVRGVRCCSECWKTVS